MFPNCFYMPLLAWATCNFGRLWNTASRSFSKLCESWNIMRIIEKLWDHVLQQLNPLQNQLSMLYSRSIDYRIDCPWQPPHPQTCIESRTPPSPVRHFWHPYQHIDSLQNQQPQERMLPLQNQPPHPHKNGHLETNFFLYNIEALFVTQVGWFCKGNFNGYTWLMRVVDFCSRETAIQKSLGGSPPANTALEGGPKTIEISKAKWLE